MSVGFSNNSSQVIFATSNPATAASTNALSQVTVGGTAAGDPFQTFTVTGGSSWSQGVDNSASDAYVVAASTALGTTNVISASTAGEINFPLQPVFFAHLPTGDSNVTGAGTVYTLGSGNALTVIQQGSGMATTGVFTVPAAGWYQFNYSIKAQQLTAAMNNALSRISVNGTNFYSGDHFITTAAASPFTTYSFRGSVVIQLAATDTVEVQLAVSNGAGNTADIMGSALTTASASYFSGIKVA